MISILDNLIIIIKSVNFIDVVKGEIKMMIKTNIGEIPIEDYLDIKALQYGFDDYADMKSNGFSLLEEKELTERDM
jgi:hypothetical protein